MKILLITGGDSSEREISFKSARNVEEELTSNGHKAKVYDLRNGYKPIIELSKKYDVLFPVLHGEEGEGGKLHKFLCKIDKPMVGTKNYKGLKNGWYKIPFKEFATRSNISTSHWKKIKNKEEIIMFGFPCVLKASHGGSSLEVVIINSESDLVKKETNRLLTSDFKLYVERYLEGVEITVGILNNSPLPVIEIVPPNGEWFNYNNKYSPETKDIPNAPSVPAEKQKEAQDIALKIHNYFNFGTYSRTDFIYSYGIPYVLETNTIPGLTSESLMPKAAKAAGISFENFLETLIQEAN